MKLILTLLAILIATSVTGILIYGGEQSQEITLTSSNSYFLDYAITYQAYSKSPVDVALANSDPSKPFYIYINSPGGEVFTGIQIIHRLRATGRKYECIANFAASMAFEIFELCPIRHVTDVGLLMAHRLQAGFPQQDIDRNDKVSDAIKDIESSLNMMIANRINMKYTEFTKLIENQFWSANFNKLRELNMIDDQVEVKCSEELSKSGGCKL